jgi:CheY-like chemotaxis protein
LADSVLKGFEHLGFIGELVNAGDIRSATATIQSRLNSNLPLDLIIVDINLPDGTGLEVIRSIKTNPVLSSIPVLVLSSETDRNTVAIAYALGANSFLPKSLEGGRFLEEIQSLYSFWLRCSLLPRQRPDLFGYAIGYKAQAAQLYTEIAKRFRNDLEKTRFWLNLSLNESNLANLLGLFHKSDCYAHASEDSVKSLEQYCSTRAAALLEAQRALERQASALTMDTALKLALDLERSFDPHAFAMGLGILFPNGPAATTALRQTTACHLSMLAQKVLSASQNSALRKIALELNAHAEEITKATQFWQTNLPV